MEEKGDGNESRPMQDLLANASEGAGRVGFPGYYFARALCSSTERGWRGRLALRAVSYRVVCTARVELFGNDFADRSYGGLMDLLKPARDEEHLPARCVGMKAGVAVHTLNPEELPDVNKLLQMLVMPHKDES